MSIATRRRKSIPLVVAALMTLLALPAVSSPAANAGPAQGVQTVGSTLQANVAQAVTNKTSKNWAGYATTTAAAGSFTSVHARWVAPKVTCNLAAQDYWVVNWVGMDGWGNNLVEQGGSSVHCLYGVAQQHTLWWEMYPHNQIQTANPINDGDTIDATVSYDPVSKTFDILIKDLTNGQTLHQVQSCPSDMSGCPRISAEVVTETPLGGTASDGVFYLPNYGTAKYTDISVTDASGHRGSLSDPAWQLVHIDQVSPTTKVTKQTTSALGADGSFQTTWVHE